MVSHLGFLLQDRLIFQIFQWHLPVCQETKHLHGAGTLYNDSKNFKDLSSGYIVPFIP